MSFDPGPHFINSLAKGLAVIQAFNEERSALSLSDVAERTGLTRATARRVLLTLEDLGLATRNGDPRHFTLTPRVLSLGHAYLSSMPLWNFAEPVLESLVEGLGQTCSIAVLDETEMVYVLRVPVRRILSQGVTIGSRLPLYCNSMGRVLLSDFTPAQLENYFERVELVAHTPRTVVDVDQLAVIVHEVRRKGYAWVRGEMEEHVGGMSVPIFNPQGRIIAALNSSVNNSPLTEGAISRQFLPRLRQAADRLNRSMQAGAWPSRRVYRDAVQKIAGNPHETA
ncbi:MAG: IclR family transcriptional regulator C-terminal domain-containing protein [Pigmentiphaga sp.]